MNGWKARARTTGTIIVAALVVLALADAWQHRDPDPGTMTVEELDAELLEDWRGCLAEEEASAGTSYPQDAGNCMDTAVWAAAETYRHFRFTLLDTDGSPVGEYSFQQHLRTRAAIITGGTA